MDTTSPTLTATDCFAVRGHIMIDLVHPITGNTVICGKSLAECRAECPEYAQAERMTIDEYCRSRAEIQESPITWELTTEARYDDMLGCVPPAYMGVNSFLVGEPVDHHAVTGRPRYAAYRHRAGVYETASRPMTIQEFKAIPRDDLTIMDEGI